MATINRINEDKWINLKRKNILLNSNGKRNSNLFSPTDKGNKIYCSKKDNNEILPIFKITKKIKIKTNEPIMPRIIFPKLKLKVK